MKQEIIKALSDGTVILASGTGILTMTLKFFDHYAAGIGAMCTIIFGLIYVLFQYLSHQKLTLADDNKDRLDAHIVETRDEFKKVGDGISLILNKIFSEF